MRAYEHARFGGRHGSHRARCPNPTLSTNERTNEQGETQISGDYGVGVGKEQYDADYREAKGVCYKALRTIAKVGRCSHSEGTGF